MSNRAFTDDVLKRSIEFAAQNAMFCGCGKIIVGFSGGADSCCMLSVLNTLKDEYGFTLTAVHINHGIRGEEAVRDADFCRDFCERNNIEFKLFEVNVPLVARQTGESVEECARRLRYGIFESLCADEHTRVATAHNADDNAETVIFNIARGSSLKGASGIPAVRDNIIRPILTCTREMTEGYCRENGIEYVTDSTNLCDEYSRNKIRHNVLPVLTDINSAAVFNFLHFSRSVTEDCDYLDCVAESAYKELFCNGSCDAQKLNDLADSVEKRVIFKAVHGFCGKKCDYSKLESLVCLCRQGGRLQLFGTVFAENVGGVFRVFDNVKADCETSEKTVSFADFPLNFGNYRFKAELYTDCSKKISDYVLDNLIDCDKIVGSLSFRFRHSGDRFTLGRRNVTKSIKKLFNELNIPLEERDCLPLLCDCEGVVWIMGVGTARRCRPDKKSTNIYLIGGEKYDK